MKKKDYKNKKFEIGLTPKEFIETDDDRVGSIDLLFYLELCKGLDQVIETSGFFHENLKLYIKKKLLGEG